jgi:hypothetical protein
MLDLGVGRSEGDREQATAKENALAVLNADENGLQNKHREK